ncbi:Nnf1-domain-containing protein [Chaetomium sp. MPI-SDFR-AT-0129]|nr:Nnf1-domain-containing protein [Chaetomium sp. MPI-SDFR-AT-0129]
MSSASAQPSRPSQVANDQDTEMLDPPPPPPQQASPEEQTEGEDAQAPSQPQPSTENPSQPQQQQPQPQDAKDQPPIPTPGPRAARLQALFASTARHTLDKISKENFEACFPTMSARAPGTLEFVQRQMVERLGGLWNREFETIMANRQVVARLNELEALVTDAAHRRREADDPTSPPVAPHTLPAPTVLQAHLLPHLTSQHTHLTATLSTTQTLNTQLWDEIRAQRAEMEALLSGVEKVMADLEGANALLFEDGTTTPSAVTPGGKEAAGGGEVRVSVAEEIAAETRAADEAIRAVKEREKEREEGKVGQGQVRG